MFIFLLRNFLFFFHFWNLECNATLTSGWEQRNSPPFFLFCFLLKLKSLLCRQGPLFVKSEPSSLASSPKTEKDQRASSPPFYPLFRSNRHPVVWLAHQPLVIQNEGLTPTVLENSFPPPWTACFKLKQGNMCQQVSPNDSSSRLWDRICEYNSKLDLQTYTSEFVSH